MLVLSSTSPQRQRLLQQLRLPFITYSPEIDETPLPNENATILVQRLAEQKARAASLIYPKATIIAADTVGHLNNEILNKPITHENATKQLTAASGKCVTFLTGLCVYQFASQFKKLSVETYEVYFKKLTPQRIENYLRKEQPYQCSGSIKEGLGFSLIERFAGDDFHTMIGLPLLRLVDFLESAGILTEN